MSPIRKRPATSGSRQSRSPARTGDYGSSVLLNGVDRQLDAYLQTQLRTETSGAAYADIRSTFLQNLQSVYGNPSETGTIEDSFNKLLTAFQGLSTSPELAVCPDRRRQRGADHGADARFGDAGAFKVCARQCRNGHQQFRHAGEQCDGADRLHQQPAAEQRQDRCSDGVAAGSARPVHHATIEPDGHPDGRQQSQSGDGVHEFGRPARRHRGGAA